MEAQTLTFRQNSTIVKQKSENDIFVNTYHMDFSTDSSYFSLPIGNTVSRGSGSVPGRIRYNTELQIFEATTGTGWGQVYVGPGAADLLANSNSISDQVYKIANNAFIPLYNAIQIAENNQNSALAIINSALYQANTYVSLAVQSQTNASSFSSQAQAYSLTAIGASNTANSAAAAAFANVSLAVAAANNSNTALASALSAVTVALTAVNNANSAAAIASSYSNLAAASNTAAGGSASASAASATVAQTYSNNANATASAIAISQTSLTANVNSLSATVSTYSGAIVTLQGRTTAYYSVVATTSGGTTALVAINADGYGSSVQLLAGKIYFGPNMVADETTTTIQITKSGHMKVTGAGFGSANQFVEWFGPTMALSAMTEANAIYYLKIDGSAYFGGTLSVGPLAPAATDFTIEAGSTKNVISVASALGSSSAASFTSSFADYIANALPVNLITGGSWLLTAVIPPYNYSVAAEGATLSWQVVVRTSGGANPQVIATGNITLGASDQMLSATNLLLGAAFPNPGGASTGACVCALQLKVSAGSVTTNPTNSTQTYNGAAFSSAYLK